MTQPVKRHRRPDFWSDIEVSEAATKLHREMTLDQARCSLKDRFGRSRCPSRSALGRYWKMLDHHQAVRAVADGIVIDERLGFALIGLIGLAVTDKWTVDALREAIVAAAQNRADQLRSRNQVAAKAAAEIRACIFGSQTLTNPSCEG